MIMKEGHTTWTTIPEHSLGRDQKHYQLGKTWTCLFCATCNGVHNSSASVLQLCIGTQVIFFCNKAAHYIAYMLCAILVGSAVRILKAEPTMLITIHVQPLGRNLLLRVWKTTSIGRNRKPRTWSREASSISEGSCWMEVKTVLIKRMMG